MQPASDQDLLAIFERIDTDHSNSIEIGELRSALLRKGLTQDECAKMFGARFTRVPLGRDGEWCPPALVTYLLISRGLELTFVELSILLFLLFDLSTVRVLIVNLMVSFNFRISIKYFKY